MKELLTAIFAMSVAYIIILIYLAYEIKQEAEKQRQSTTPDDIINGALRGKMEDLPDADNYSFDAR